MSAKFSSVKNRAFAILAAATMVAPAAFAAPQQAIGQVSSATAQGTVLVKRGGSVYSLGPNSAIFEGDEIFTRNGGAVTFTKANCAVSPPAQSVDGKLAQSLSGLQTIVVSSKCAAETVSSVAETAVNAVDGSAGGISVQGLGATPLLILPAAALAALAGANGSNGASVG